MDLIKTMVAGVLAAFAGLVILVLGPVITTSTATIGANVVTNIDSSVSTTPITDVNDTATDTFKMFAQFLMLAGIATIGYAFMKMKIR